MVSFAVSGTRVPAESISGAGAAGLAGAGLGRGAFFSGAAFAGWLAGAGTSFMAAVDSVGASVRLRAVESEDWLVCSPFAQARNPAIARLAASCTPCRWMLFISPLLSVSQAPNIRERPSEFPYETRLARWRWYAALPS